MTTLTLQSFDTLVNNMAAQAQASASVPLNLTDGSVLRAIFEADASVALWLQWQAVQIMSATRLASSNGADADSFVNDFNLTRLPAVSSTGTVALSRYTSGTVVNVAPGATLKTADGTLTFTVVADTGQGAWNASAGAYQFSSGATSINVTVVCSTAGTAGNVLAGAISVISSTLPGVDTATNAAAFANGINAESDAALKVRFVNYISSLSRATEGAVSAAIAGVQQGLAFTIQENTPSAGYFTVTVDDGTGSPSSALLALVYAAVAAVRGVCITPIVQGPSNTGVVVSMTISVAAGAVAATVAANVAAAVLAYINALTVGSVLRYTRLAQVAYDADASVTNVASLLVNSATADVDPGATGVVRVTGGAAGVTVSH
jgi:hypothetical protein